MKQHNPVYTLTIAQNSILPSFHWSRNYLFMRGVSFQVANILFKYISNKMQLYTVCFIWKLLYIFRMVPPPIVRSTNNFIYSIWYLSHRYCYLPLSWKSWNWYECAVGGVSHPQHTHTSSNSSTIAVGSSNGVTYTRCCRYSCLCS